MYGKVTDQKLLWDNGFQFHKKKKKEKNSKRKLQDFWPRQLPFQ